MTGTVRRVAAILVALAAAVWLVMLYRDHQREVAREAEREAPVVAPSRIGTAQGAAMVTLDSAEARRVGLQVAALRPAASRPEERLPAEVVPESERTAVLRAPVAGRFMAPAGARWPKLGERVAAGVALAQVSDARPLSLPIGGVVTRVGAQPGALVEAGQMLLEVADYSRPLVRVAWLERAGGVPVRRLSLSAGDGAPRVDARLVGPAPEADPVTRRPAYLYRATRSWPGATPGTPVEAIVPGQSGPASEGVLVPDPAVVQWEGLAWAYRQRAPGRFERARVTTSRPAPGGWIAGPPFAPGDSVVVRGAEELLSEEFRARVTVGDESGE
jgi:biotin carboxyl carrier protein